MENLELKIISKYMDSVLMNGKNPESIYKFSKENEIEEQEFYKYFSSFDHIEKTIFGQFATNSLALLEKNEDFSSFDSKNRLLSFYFTFFETLSANRSYVLYALENHSSSLKNLKKLHSLKLIFIDFIKTLEIEKIEIKQDKLQKLQEKGMEESFWIQLLLVLKFWMNDTSPSFEKTDLFIEKSLQASFDMMNTQPIKSILDLGKFILKETIDYKL